VAHRTPRIIVARVPSSSYRWTLRRVKRAHLFHRRAAPCVFRIDGIASLLGTVALVFWRIARVRLNMRAARYRYFRATSFIDRTGAYATSVRSCCHNHFSSRAYHHRAIIAWHRALACVRRRLGRRILLITTRIVAHATSPYGTACGTLRAGIITTLRSVTLCRQNDANHSHASSLPLTVDSSRGTLSSSISRFHASRASGIARRARAHFIACSYLTHLRRTLLRSNNARSPLRVYRRALFAAYLLRKGT